MTFPNALLQYFGLMSLDPTGAAAQVHEWVPRYKTAASERHAAFLATWGAGDQKGALVELHFFLIAVTRIAAFMEMAGCHLGGDVKLHVDSRDFAAWKDARNHMEHIEDRLFGSGRNRPQPITEGGATRTINLGLRAADHHFTYSTQAVDVSATFLAGFLNFVDKFLDLVATAGAAAAPRT